MPRGGWRAALEGQGSAQEGTLSNEPMISPLTGLTALPAEKQIVMGRLWQL